MNQIVPKSKGDVLEQVIIKGDLAGLSADQRIEYYHRVCESVGLNPLTKPFEYITLNGKLTLYALRACTDQLRSVHNVSVEDVSESERDGVFIVTAKVRNAAGRTDTSKGAVNISGLKGEALANAIMKAETKAKRRATLSICGLGFLDESELETIPASAVSRPATPPPAPKLIPPSPSAQRPLTEAEERELDRDSYRQMRGETPEESGGDDLETSGEAGPAPAPEAVLWGRKALEKCNGFTRPGDFNAWYTPAIQGAISRLREHSPELQTELIAAVIAQQDRWNPVSA